MLNREFTQAWAWCSENANAHTVNRPTERSFFMAVSRSGYVVTCWSGLPRDMTSRCARTPKHCPQLPNTPATKTILEPFRATRQRRARYHSVYRSKSYFDANSHLAFNAPSRCSWHKRKSNLKQFPKATPAPRPPVAAETLRPPLPSRWRAVPTCDCECQYCNRFFSAVSRREVFCRSTASVSALRLPTRTTSRLPRVIPV